MYEWLKDYQELEQKIEYLEFNLERSKKELDRWVYGDLAKYKLTAESDGAQLEERIEVIEYEVAHLMNDLYDMQKMMKAFKGLDSRILYLKYVDGMTLECIAEEVGYSSSHIKKRHAEIMRAMQVAKEYSSL
ncbi:sigma factor-like helix-turn-helix DNA-binding protein [Sporosarcina newyorkensis]|uniref:sigma factor-like helix-turn-helix DNA-binding protein n=1 Tax=Sporosarcina newyorkensis TaxID=759851 RepID=UPI003D057638